MSLRRSSILLMAAVVAGCASSEPASPPSAADLPSLKAAYADDFLIGTALNARQYTGQDARAAPIVPAQFDAISPENVMKWESLHPQPGVYDFEGADAYVAYGEEHDMWILGHTLVWHSQTPRWVFQDDDGDPVSREVLLGRMEDHISTVVGRYKGRVDGWDVVNEALNEDGTLRDSPWRRIIGDDYLVHAFRFAHAADPDAELYYNDYSLENKPKRDGAVRLVRMVQEAGGRVTGIGTQGHYHMAEPTVAQIDSTIRAFAELGDVMVTELEIDVLPSRGSMSADVGRREEGGAGLDPYTDGLPDDVQQALADRYAEIFEVFLDHREVISRVTFWGVTDGDSWKNGFPIPGRTNHPLLFDRAGQPKPAYDAVVRVARTDR